MAVIVMRAMMVVVIGEVASRSIFLSFLYLANQRLALEHTYQHLLPHFLQNNPTYTCMGRCE